MVQYLLQFRKLLNSLGFCIPAPAEKQLHGRLAVNPAYSKQAFLVPVARGIQRCIMLLLLFAVVSSADRVSGQCYSWNAFGGLGVSQGNAFYTNMVFDRFGGKYVAYADGVAGTNPYVLKYNGSSWDTLGGGPVSLAATSFVSMAIDSVTGTPYVVYVDQSVSNKVTVMKFDGTSWGPVGTPGISPGGASQTCIAIDALGTPYVAFVDGTIFAQRVMKFTSGSWTTVGSAGLLTGNASYTSLAIHAGVPYVAFEDYNSSFGLTVKYFNGSDWALVGGTSNISGVAITYAQIAIDANRNVYVVYTDGTNATVKKFDGTNWSNAGNAAFSPEATFTTIALDGSGNPYVAFSDYSRNTNATVMKLSGSTWVNVGNPGISSSGASYTSIAIDASGTPYVAYEDIANSYRLTVQQLVQGAPFANFVSPAVGNPADAVSIFGSGFNTNPTQNIVYFGATQATVTAATSVLLNVTVPKGATYMPVSVDNPGCGLVSYTYHPFLPTYNNGGYNNDTTSFAPQFTLGTGSSSNPAASAIADIDGDGKPDLVILNSTTENIVIYRNISSSGSLTPSSFDGGTTINLTVTPGDLAVGDINGDGKLDLVISNYSTGNVSVLRNISTSGTVSFAGHADFSCGNNPFGVALGDIDGDGMTDIVVANSNVGNTISVLRNQGTLTTISFASAFSFTAGATSSSPEKVAIGDLTNDGKPDIAVTNYNTNTVAVFRNNATSGTIDISTFNARVDVPCGTHPWGVAIADMDGDGKLDLVVAAGSDSVSVIHSIYSGGLITTGSFETKVQFLTGFGANNLAVGDINGDGMPDIVMSNSGGGSSSVSVLRSKAVLGSITTASFAIKADYALGNLPQTVSIGDLDGDGLPDIAIANEIDNTISILRNTPTPAIPVITSVSPLVRTPGQQVTITGKMFNSNPADNIVYFGATQASVNSATGTSLNVNVPYGATYFPVSVNNTASARTGSAPLPFLPFYNNSSYVPNTVNFDPKVDIGTGTSPYGVTIGDIDGDGLADIVVTNQTANTMSIYRNISSTGSLTTGSFATKVDIGTGGNPQSAVIQDIDGDGKPDIVVANYNDGTISIYRNIGSPGSITPSSFATKVDFTVSTIAGGPFGIVVGDMNGDGKPDIAVACYIGNYISVRQNTSTVGSLSFDAYSGFSTNSNPGIIVMGDVDGDGKPELAIVSGAGTGYLSVYHNISTPTAASSAWFDIKQDFATNTYPEGLAIGDLNADGKLDIVVGSGAYVSVFQNTASLGVINSSSFASKVDFPVSSPFSIAIGDVDGDGKPDIAVANDLGSSLSTVSVFRNTYTSGVINTSSFAGKVDYGTGKGSVWVAMGDLDGDQLPDMVVVNDYSGVNTMSVLRNDPLQPISGFSGMCIGDTRTLNDATQGGTWSSSNTNIAIIGSLTGSITAFTTGTVTVTYSVAGGSTTQAIAVIPALTANFTISHNPTCPGVADTFTDSGSGFYFWVNGDGTTSSGNAVEIHTYDNPGTYAVMLTVNNLSGCSASTTQTLTVSSQPTDIVGTLAVLPGNTTALTDATPGGIWSSSNSAVATINNSGLVSGVSLGYTNISYTVANTCNYTPVTHVVVSKVINTFAGMYPGSGGGGIVGGGGIIGGGDATDGTAARGAGLLTLYNVAVDTSENVYFTEPGNNDIRMVSAVTGLLSTIAGSGSSGYSGDNGPATASVLNNPAGIAVDKAGNIYFADKGNNSVRMINTAGTITNFAGNGNPGYGGDGGAANVAILNSPDGVAVDAAGNVYISDMGNDLVRKVDISGNISTVAGMSLNAGFSGDGGPATSAQLWSPSGVAVDATGNLYIADAGNNRVREVNVAGTITTLAGNGGSFPGFHDFLDGDFGPATAAAFNDPNGVAVDPSGNVYIADAGNRVVRIVDPSGTLLPYAALSADGNAGDGGPAPLALMLFPTGVAMDKLGNLFIADQSNRNVRIVGILPSYQPSQITGYSSACVNNTVTLSDALTGGTWSSDNSSVATIDQNSGVVSAVAVGTTNITYSVSGGVAASLTFTVTASVGAVTGVMEVCAGATTTLNAIPAGGSWISNDPVNNPISNSGILSANTSGTVAITYLSGCGVATATVTVDPMPTANPANNGPSCGGGSVTLFTQPGGNAGIYTWSGPGGFTSSMQNPLLSPAVAGVYSVVVSSGSVQGCSPSAIYTTTVSAGGGLPITGNTTVCTGATTTLSNASPGGTWGVISSSVAFVNQTTGVVTGQSAGSTVVSYTIGGCVTSATITVIPGVTGNYAITPSTLCAGSSATLTATYLSCAGAALGLSGVPSGGGGIHTGVVTTATNNLTIEAWVMWNGTGGIQTIVSNGKTATPGASGYTLTVQSGVVQIYLEGVAVMNSASNLTPNQWTHVALTRATGASGIWKLYYNGVAIALSNSTANPIVPTGYLCVGTDEDSYTGSFAGSIDEVKIWNIARTATQIAADMTACSAGPQAGLVGYWSFNEGAGATAADGSGNGNSLNLTANTWPVSGATTNSYSFATGDGTTLIGASTQMHTYNTGGSFTSSVTVTNGSGCSVTATAPVTVQNYPGYIQGGTGVCLGGTTTLSTNGPGGTWTSSNNSVATVDLVSGVVSGVSIGYDTITYATGCGTPMTIALGVSVPTTGTFNINPSPICTGTTATLTANYSTCAGGAMVFNGSNSDAVHNGVVTNATNNLTIEAWVKWNGSSGIQTIAENGTAGSSGYQFAINNGSLVGIIGGVTMTSSSGLTAGQWAHVALVRNSGTWSVNYNGTTFSISNNTTTPATPSGNFTVGANSSGAQVFDGTIDEVKIWTVARGGTQITRDMDACSTAAQTGLAGYWSFNEGSGFSANDGSGNGNSLLCGSITWTTQGGAPNQYVFWPGMGSFISGNYQQTQIYNIAGNYSPYVVVYNAEGCASTSSLNINVYTAPTAISGASSVLVGSTIALSDATAGGTWSIPSSTIAIVNPTTGVVTGQASGTAVVTYTTGSGCMATKLITVNPAAPASAVLCVGTTVLLSDGVTGGTWSSTNNSYATVNASTGLVTGVAAGSLSIKHTLPSGYIVVFPITVNPLSATTGLSVVCQGSSITLVNATTGGGIWSSSNTLVATVIGSGAVTGVSGGPVIITFTSAAGCVATKTVTVNPIAAITGGTPVCVGQLTHLSNAISGGTWSSTNNSYASVTPTTGIVTGVNAGSLSIKYTLSTGCISTLAVMVNPLSASTGAISVCQGATTTLVNSTAGGGAWSSGNTSIAIVGATSGSVVGVGGGNMPITFTTAAGCITSKTVTVNATTPITGPTSVCIGQTIKLSDATSNGTWSSTTLTQATVTPLTGIVSGLASGSAIIKYLFPSGCSTTATITVNPLSATTGTSSVCQGQTTALANGTTGGGAWSSNNTLVATVGSTGVVTGVSGGPATISFTSVAGCITTKTVTINPTAPIIGPAQLCVGQPVQLSDAISSGTWSSSNNSYATVNPVSGLVTGVAAGSLTVNYTSPSGCLVSLPIMVNPLSATTGNSVVCPGSAITLVNTTAGGGAWGSSNSLVATVSTTGSVTGVTSGPVVISFTTPAGCITTKSVTVSPGTGTILGSGSVCVGSTVVFSDAVTGGTWNASSGIVTINHANGTVNAISAGTVTISYTLGSCTTTVNLTVGNVSAITGASSICAGNSVALNDVTTGGVWTSDNTTTATVVGGVVTGLTAGTANITYAVTGGCYAATAVAVLSSPSLISGNTTVCAGSMTMLSDAVSGGTWSSVNMTIATVNPVSGAVIGVVAGSATINYLLASGCLVSKVVTVNATPLPITGATSICAGVSANLNDATSGGVWTSDNTATATMSGQVVTGVTAGTAGITYTTTNGCYASTGITVLSSPSSISGVTTLCAGAMTTLSDAVSGGTWSSVNMSIATVNPVSGAVTGVVAGSATINYLLASGCLVSKVVTVNATPLPITGTTSICAGTSANLNDATSGGVWTSDNTATATMSGQVVTGVTAGTAGITYTTTNGCYASTGITVLSSPSSISGVTTLCAGSMTTLSDAVTGGTWNSAVPSVAAVDPVSGIVTGSIPGTATITYVLSSGCIVSTNVTINTTPQPIAGATSICSGTTALSDAVTGGAWSSNNSVVAIVGATSGIVTAGASGAAVITYMLGTGCLATTTINVSPLPAITGTTNVCAGLTTALTDQAAGGVWSSSISSVATIGAVSGVVTGVATGTVIITYTNGTGCYTLTQFTVNASPAVITGTQLVCAGSTVSLFDATTGGVWSSLSSSVATIGTTGIVTGVSNGTSVISYVAAGCPRTATVTVQAAAPITGNTTLCAGQTTTLSNSVAGGAWSSSSNSYATVVPATGVVTGLAAGTPTITYTLPSGCFTTTSISVRALLVTTGNATVCGGQTLLLYNNTTGGGVWSSSNTLIATVSSTGVVTGGYNTSVNTVTILFTAAAGCVATKTVTVNAAMPVTGVTTVCTGQTTLLSNALVGGTWSSSNAGNASVTSAGVVSGSAAGTPIISYSTSSCISLATVTVRALTVITGGATVCQGSTLPLYNTTPGGGVWSSATTTVATVTATGVVDGVSAGSAGIVFTANDGCVTTKTVTVNVCPGHILDTATTSIGSVVSGIENITLFPNPNKGTFSIKGALATQEDADVSIEIIDMLGQVIFKKTITAQNGAVNEQIQLDNNVANSMYLVNVRSGNEYKVFHIVVEQ